ncbi:MAG: tetratricopeptide repeat protein, partial [Gemmataceae bacterium]|nr:tetratricopeptide repeat protein [Gemmataceae bacterium]
EGVVKAQTPRPPEKVFTFAELEAAHKKSPDDPDLAARLAGEYLRRDKPDDARKLLDAVRAKDKTHPGAALVLSRLLKRAKDIPGAQSALEEAIGAHSDDSRLRLELGKLFFEQKEFDKAAAQFEHGRKVAPGEGDWLEQLARVYEAARKPDQLAGVLEALTATNPDDLALALRLAKLYANADKHADVERVARRALHIDVLNAQAKELLFSALAAQKKDKELETLRNRYQ